jgi:DNA ligase-1
MSQRKGIQLAYPLEEKRLAKWRPPYIVQPKYDGERCRAVPIEKGKYMLLSSQENPIFSVPHVIDDLNTLEINTELDGELYCHGMSFEDIHSIVSREVNPHPNREAIKYHIFDCVSEESQLERIVGVSTEIPLEWKSLVRVPYHLCHSLEDIMRVYDQFLNKGYEGIIVRHFQAPYIRRRSIYMMKFKPKRKDTYEIVGWKEEVDKDGNRKDSLGALICVGDDGTQFSVGSGLTQGDRRNYWDRREDLIGNLCRVSYQHVTTRKKVPRFPVFMEVIE